MARLVSGHARHGSERLADLGTVLRLGVQAGGQVQFVVNQTARADIRRRAAFKTCRAFVGSSPTCGVKPKSRTRLKPCLIRLFTFWLPPRLALSRPTPARRSGAEERENQPPLRARLFLHSLSFAVGSMRSLRRRYGRPSFALPLWVTLTVSGPCALLSWSSRCSMETCMPLRRPTFASGWHAFTWWPCLTNAPGCTSP